MSIFKNIYVILLTFSLLMYSTLRSIYKIIIVIRQKRRRGCEMLDNNNQKDGMVDTLIPNSGRFGSAVYKTIAILNVVLKNTNLIFQIVEESSKLFKEIKGCIKDEEK